MSIEDYKKPPCECEQLRADIARQRDLIRELEAAASLHWLTEEELRHVRADLARVTEERDEVTKKYDELWSAHLASLKMSNVTEAELAALRARVAELVTALECEKKIHPEDFTAGDFRTQALARARAESATPAVAEESSVTRTPGLRSDNPLAEPVMGGLPRHDGGKLGTPAKHPDTVRLDWLERAESGEARRCLAYNNIRAAIDAARKQGGSAHD